MLSFVSNPARLFACALVFPLLGAAVPATFGPPCLCFPLRCAEAPRIPESALGKAGWTPQRLCDEALDVARNSDDPFARAEHLRRALLELQHSRETSKGDVPAALERLLEGLENNLKREAELVPLSKATLVPARDASPDAAARQRAQAALAALPGVQRVEPQPGGAGLVAWFDAAKVGAGALGKATGFGTEPRVEAPSKRGQALAALALAFAGEGARELGHEVDFDPCAHARAAAALAPQDAALALVAGMVVFDRDPKGAAKLGQDALRQGRGNELVEHNLRSVYGAYFSAKTLDELSLAWEKRLAGG
jgi:hypothetical protein